MKKNTILLFTYILLSATTSLWGQATLILNTKRTTGGTETACQSIILQPGFSFNSTTASLTLRVDPSTCDPYAGTNSSISSNQNYIQTKTYTADDGSRYMEAIQYFDGLGRPIQTVQRCITPGTADLVTLQEYDAFGREDRTWLPAVASGNNGAYMAPATYKTKAMATYNSTAYNTAADSVAYSRPFYEASPLNRVLKQFGPGADWQKNDKGVFTDYKTNSGTTGILSCALFSVTGAGVNTKVNKNNFYANAQLYVTQTTDEDGNTGYEFKDKLDQVVLTRQVASTNDTYYVYDDFGNLCFVLPPGASTGLSNGNWDETNSTSINQYAYLYKYDNRNRCIAKKLPGCEWIYYVYDKADRLIFTQDGENRKKSEWQFSIPDVFGRIILTGICKNSFTYSANPLNTMVVRGIYNASRSNLANSYTISGVTLISPAILTANYYDEYAFMGITEVPNNVNTQYNAESGYNTRYTVSYKGMHTGTVTAQMNADGTLSSTYLYSVMYYDSRNRVIQVKSNNPLAGGMEKEYIAYNFTGQPTTKKHIHQATGKTTQTELYTYNYDHAGRLTKVTHQLNNVSFVTTIAENTYDELGRLKTNKKGGLANLYATYGYSIRSWLKSITSPFFTETLYYNESYGGSSKRYNGNVSAMNWKLSGETNTRGYAFSYDTFSRLTAANYLENGSANTNYKTAYTYDPQGNIKTLQRYGKTTATTYGLIDNLTLSYSGNQLDKVDDAIATLSLAESADFKNYNNTPVEYFYNANGSMTKDLNKGLSDIQYNSLNLPRLMDIKSPVAEARNEYTYSAAGQKLKVVQKWNPNYSTVPFTGSAINVSSLTMSKTTDYIGNMIYENGALKRILIEGGYIDGGVYYYYQTDHQGNNRLVVDVNGSVTQKNHYYPYGTAFAETPVAEQGKQPYKYNGKELDPMHGLNLYDYSARQYESALGRFTTMDPLCEKYYSVSPYVYCLNNPVRFVDPDGRIPIETIWDVGNVLYDIGAAVVNHIKGDHQAAKSNWVDLGLDAGAMLIPYVPAGVTKAVKVADKAVDAAKVVDKAGDVKKASTITENAAKGKAFEKQVGESLGNNKASQVTIEAADGTRTKVDFAQKQNGKVTLTEAKGSQTAPLTGNQKAAHPQIETGGGTVKGNKGTEIGLPAGTKIPPTKVEVIRPEDLLRR